MKKYSKIAYSFLILIVLLSGFIVYKTVNKKESNQAKKNKALADVQHLESEFVDLFNKMNNINFENYKISSSDIKGKKSEKEVQSSGQSGEKSGENQGKSGSGGNNESSGQIQSQSQSQENSEDSGENKEYKLKSTGILTGEKEINWEEIKNNVERLYTTLYPATLDLYQVQVNQEDIVNFNKEYDNLTKAVKNQNKDEIFEELVVLYDYFPRFVEKCTDDPKEKIVINTKNYIFKAYSVLEQEEWGVVSENINKASEEFTKLVTDINNKEKENQYNINKIYIIINELQNAVLIRDKEVFLIKYKNLLEEIENI